MSAQEGSKAHSRFSRPCREAGNLLTRSLTHCCWLALLFVLRRRTAAAAEAAQHRHKHTIDTRAHTYGPRERLINTFWIDSNFSSTAHLNHLTNLFLCVPFVPLLSSFFFFFLILLLGLLHTHHNTHTHTQTPTNTPHTFRFTIVVIICVSYLFLST